MKHTPLLILFLVLYPLFFSCSSKGKMNPAVREDDLIAGWKTIQGDAEEMLMDKDGNERMYRTFLHERPFQTGEWSLKQGKLTVKLVSGETFIYHKIVLTNDILTLYNEDGSTEQYEKIYPQMAAYTLLMEIRKNMRIGFSRPVQAEFSWNRIKPDTTDVENVVCKGWEYSISLDVQDGFTKANAESSRVTDYLGSLGFRMEEHNVTEIGSGWVKDNIACFVVLNNSGTLVVKAGLLE